jgi:predicted nucleic acid-binding Zn ribbon protein
MDRAGKFIRKLNLPEECVTAQELAKAAWPHAVGKRIAAHTRAVGLNGGFLIVEVADSVWQTQLEALRGQILPKLREIAGDDAVAGIEFRRGVPRRPAARAGDTPGDEADQIRDPGLRRLYVASRKRSQA